MSRYIVQSLLLGLLLVLLSRNLGRFNLFQTAFAATWTLSVIIIRFMYGQEQSQFYSNDQEAQLQMLYKFERDGLQISIEQVISNRYVVIIPAWILKTVGFEPLLAFKFFQALCLLFIYKMCSNFLKNASITVKTWHTLFFVGPLFIFISTIGIRDIQIVLCSTIFFLSPSVQPRVYASLIALLLRPHLAVALIFGLLIRIYFSRFQLQRPLYSLPVLVIGAFAAGAIGHSLGTFVQYGISMPVPKIFLQDNWWRVFANFIGVQFLTFGEDVVAMTTQQLLALRILFADTFIIPSLFIVTLLFPKTRFSDLRVQVFVSFVFFLGLVSQTNFNSSRQNMPFLSVMGVLGLVAVLKPDKSEFQKE